MLRRLANFRFLRGYASTVPELLGATDIMASGSENLLVTGTGKNVGYKGPAIIGSVVGSQVMMNAGDDYAGLGSFAETGLGNVFRVLGAFFFIGAGLFYRNGVSTAASATTTLSIKTVTSGALGTTFQAGLARPSAPTITAVEAPTGFTGKVNGVVSAQIARVRSATGARSNGSPVSNVVQATNQSIAVTFPSADTNGQDYWEVDVTKHGFGGLGPHYFLQEIPESVITATVVANATTDADTTITLPNDTLTSTHIGWQYTSAGDTTTYVTAVGADDSGGAGNQLITLNAASVLTTTQSATFTRAVDGIVRTMVFEWRDGDLAGSDFAPIRDYPPPAALFGGVSEDVVFVDGAFGDTVNVTKYAIDQGLSRANTTVSTPGNVIAVSDPARPESFPPDNYIFTGDAPVAILPGGNGIHWRFAKNSLGVIRYVGGSPALSYERIWTGIGIQNQRQACLGAGGRLYAYTAARGAVRLGIGGEPDTAFAARVADDMAVWTAANVVLGYDADHQMILFCHGDDILAYYEPADIWCAPLDGDPGPVFDTFNIKSIVTQNGSALIAMASTDDTAIYLYNFNEGAGRGIVVVTPWMHSQVTTDIVSRLHVTGRFDNAAQNVSVFVRKNGSASNTTSQSVDITATGFQHLPVLKPNVRGCKSFRVVCSYTSSGGDSGFEYIAVDGTSQDISL